MKDKILIGYAGKNNPYQNENSPVYLKKHSWDCGWYWGFGYLGNNNCHYHMESLITEFCNGNYEIDSLIQNTFTLDNWWKLLDAFKQAYALRRAAECYKYNGHFSSMKQFPWTSSNQENAEDKAASLNKDLEILLDGVWEYMLTLERENGN